MNTIDRVKQELSGKLEAWVAGAPTFTAEEVRTLSPALRAEMKALHENVLKQEGGPFWYRWVWNESLEEESVAIISAIRERFPFQLELSYVQQVSREDSDFSWPEPITGLLTSHDPPKIRCVVLLGTDALAVVEELLVDLGHLAGEMIGA